MTVGMFLYYLVDWIVARQRGFLFDRFPRSLAPMVFYLAGRLVPAICLCTYSCDKYALRMRLKPWLIISISTGDGIRSAPHSYLRKASSVIPNADAAS